MRLALIADVHANHAALRAVLEACGKERVDEIVCLGDIVGYGPDAAECVGTVRSEGIRSIQGNHDAAVAAPPDPEAPRSSTLETWQHARRTLKPDDLDFLTSLRPTIDLKGLVLCAHGSPTDRDEYVRTTTRMNEILSSAATRICAVGHTHVQYAFDGTKRVTGASDEIQLDAGGRMLVNPGSVGQPRDEDNRAAYAILDLEEGLLALKRVEYDIETTVQKIYGLGLPGVFAERIRRGR